ncbi:MAG TPA: S-methyl-5-thioribose-1-phosphate isomerase, partial [Planctomycetia bacterium]|nr:S-methyl-5-thioribose-1-phosphate isomerase [Planctomycetia bacterium]
MIASQIGSQSGDGTAAALASARKAADYLRTCRPTAVNLFWALDRMTVRAEAEKGQPRAEFGRRLLA